MRRRTGTLWGACLIAILATGVWAQTPSEEEMQEELAKQTRAVESAEAAQVEALLNGYKQQLEADAGNVTARFYYGNLLALNKDMEKAREQFERVIRDDPRFTPAYTRMAAYYRKKGQLELERQELERALQIDPKDYRVNLELGEYYLGRNDLTRAQNHLETAAAARPNARLAEYRLGRLHYTKARAAASRLDDKAAKQEYVDAIDHFKKVIFLGTETDEQGKPTFVAVDNVAATTYFYLGHCYYHSGDKTRAYDSFKLAAGHLPRSKEKMIALQNVDAISKELGLDPLWDAISQDVKLGLDSENPAVRIDAAKKLCSFYKRTGSSQALDLMATTLTAPHADQDVRTMVARYMGNPDREVDDGGRARATVLQVLKNDSSTYVRAAAAYALAEMNDPSTMSALVDALATSQSYEFGEILRALHKLAGTETPTKTGVEKAQLAEPPESMTPLQRAWEARDQVRQAWRDWLESH